VTQPPALRAKALAAYVIICLTWGTTFLAIAYALRAGLPPFACAALRFITGGLALYAWLRLRSPQPLAGLPLARIAASGVLLLSAGNGFVVWAQQGVPSGITALLIASAPLVVMLTNWLGFERRAPAPWALVGALVGLSGVALTLSHMHVISGAARPVHLLSLLVAIVAWAVGTLLVRGQVPVERVAAGACVQMLAGGAVLVLMGYAAGDWQRLDVRAIAPSGWLALSYLTLFGSIIAMSCYLWLLGHIAPQKVMTYALVNPLVALLLGAALLGERLTATVGIAVVLVLAGVSIVLLQGRSKA
jgi:drug/metabolite transporter (DMT)-like permease